MTVQGRRSSSSSPSMLSFSSTPNGMSTDTNIMESSSKISPLMRSILKLRSGEDIGNEADEEEESDDESDDEEEDDASSSAIDYADILQKVLERTMEVTKEVVEVTKERFLPVVVKYSKKTAVTAKKTSVSIYEAVRRAISAALEGDDTEEDEDSDDEDSDDEGGEVTVLEKVIVISKKSVAIVKRMIKAALTVPEDEGSAEEYDETDDEDEEATVESTEDEIVADSQTIEVGPTSTSSSAVTDFGSYLAEAYGVDDMRNSGKTEGPIILGGTLEDALQTARQQARMLLVFIPSGKPEGERGGLSSFFGGGKKGDAELDEKDRVAIESLLSKEVGKAANKKAKKKSDHGSFAIWGGKAGSSEAASAMKQLKVKETSAKGEERPILCVVYPAVASVGSDKMIPKVLAQHHCNPPMKAESMASWMNALRKRHGKQYQGMQTDLNELELYQERQEGYINSVQSDNERKQKEAEEEAERKAQEIKEAARQAEIDSRRQELQQSLPEDVKKGNDVKKIALRFSDGRSGQRGFASDQPLSVVFDWVDAMFEIERETVVLTTLNGKQTFSWNGEEMKSGKTLQDAGLNKMTAFRVTAT